MYRKLRVGGCTMCRRLVAVFCTVCRRLGEITKRFCILSKKALLTHLIYLLAKFSFYFNTCKQFYVNLDVNLAHTQSYAYCFQ